MLDRGDGSVEDIDKSLELGAGHPMGPLTLAVSVGLQRGKITNCMSYVCFPSYNVQCTMVSAYMCSCDGIPFAVPPMLKIQDYVGLDTCLSILDGWVNKYPDEPSFVVPECLRQKVSAGKLGRKTGEGFYVWNGDKRADVAP